MASKTVRVFSKRFFAAKSSRQYSSFVHDAYHRIQSTIVSNLPQEQHALYSEEAAREWLSGFPGGKVHLETDNSTGVAQITFDNVDKKNAFSGKMMVDLADAVSKLASWSEGRAVIVRGAGGEFCSGGDLNFMSKIADPMSGAQMCIFMQNVTSRLLHLPLISVALIEGRALGGGMELAVACDYRLMHQSARIGFVQSRLGITSGWGGGTHLTKHIGYNKSLYLLSSAKLLTADESLAIHLADHVIDSPPGDATLAECQNWLKPFLQGSPGAVKYFKRIVMNAKECSYADALNRERDMFQQLWGGPAHKRELEKMLKK